jgi:hypothetical protein
MVLYFGRERVKELGPVAPANCRVCGEQTWARLYRQRPWVTLFSLPLVPLSTTPTHKLVCENCFAAKPIEGEDLDRALAQREETEALIAGELSWEDYAETVETFSAGVSDDLATEPPDREEPRGFA